MKIRSIVPVMLAIVSMCRATAQDPTPADAAEHGKAPAKAQVYDYQDLPINNVLRDLARDAKINLTIGNGVKGNLTFHLEEKTPLQTIQAIADFRNLLFKEMDGAYYIVTQDDWRELMRNRYFFEAPELPGALAKFEKRYYDALVKEGFSKEEALKIITSQTLPPRDLRFNN